MKKQEINPAEEFDEAVAQYNKYLDSLKRPVQRRYRWNAFLTGIASALDISGSFIQPSETFRNHPLYSRKDLSPQQKDAIALASDLQRASNSSLDSNERALAQEMYEHFRSYYISNAKS